jgi:hypothetical protein
LKGWANIGRRFANKGTWPVTFLVSENTFKGQGVQVSFIENGTDS